MYSKYKFHYTVLTGVFIALAGCEKPIDLDLRRGQTLNTSDAAINATANRPVPDKRGIISYPGYQVVVARRGDTVSSVASRIGVSANELATYNGLAPDDTLRAGEVLALRKRVAEPAGGPIRPTPKQPVDIESVASGAISDAESKSVETSKLPPATTAKEASKKEPVRHTVKRGETAYSISRLYNVSLRSLADWNGLDAQYNIREGQHLLIPVAIDGQAPKRPEPKITEPGTGSPTPVPPSAAKPLPKQDLKPAAETKAEVEKTPKAAPDLSKTQTASKPKGKMAYPVNGDIVREYAKGRNEGIDIAAAAGATVGAAEAGVVAAVTEDSSGGVPIIVVKHSNGLLTIYSNVDKVAVKKGQTVSRGQKLAQMRDGNHALHFEVRKGFDSVDPMLYLN